MRLAVVVVFTVCTTAWAQNAEITGRITDPGGAVVPNAEVVITNTGTGNRVPGATISRAITLRLA